MNRKKFSELREALPTGWGRGRLIEVAVGRNELEISHGSPPGSANQAHSLERAAAAARHRLSFGGGSSREQPVTLPQSWQR
jgi:hypothetical protein